MSIFLGQFRFLLPLPVTNIIYLFILDFLCLFTTVAVTSSIDHCCTGWHEVKSYLRRAEWTLLNRNTYQGLKVCETIGSLATEISSLQRSKEVIRLSPTIPSVQLPPNVLFTIFYYLPPKNSSPYNSFSPTILPISIPPIYYH